MALIIARLRRGGGGGGVVTSSCRRLLATVTPSSSAIEYYDTQSGTLILILIPIPTRKLPNLNPHPNSKPNPGWKIGKHVKITNTIKLHPVKRSHNAHEMSYLDILNDAPFASEDMPYATITDAFSADGSSDIQTASAVLGDLVSVLL